MQKHEGGIASICSFVLPNPHPSLLCLAVLFITTKKQCLEKATLKTSARIPGMRTPNSISVPGQGALAVPDLMCFLGAQGAFRSCCSPVQPSKESWSLTCPGREGSPILPPEVPWECGSLETALGSEELPGEAKATRCQVVLCREWSGGSVPH